MSASASVVTLASGREGHLENLLAGLNHSRRRPKEVVLVCMNGWRPATGIRAGLRFPVREVPVESAGGGLPLAAARNAGAHAARSGKLIFLDVDCIPGPNLIWSFSEALESFDGLLMGEVMYLPPGAADGFDKTAGLPGALP